MRSFFLLCFLPIALYGSLEEYEAILIYQFGKVGSTSLWHCFGEMTLDRRAPIEAPNTIGIVVHTHEKEIVKRFLNLKARLLIINVSRNLLTKNPSSFFQFMAHEDSEWFVDTKNNILHSGHYPFQRIKNLFQRFNKRYTKAMGSWYQNFNRLLKIDLFSEPFDVNKKYIFIKKGSYDILFMRFEDISEWPRILEEALNLQGVKIPYLNNGKTKRYSHLYDRLKRQYHYSEEELEAMWDCDFMQHFYLPFE